MHIDLSGTTALVTGSTKGIGLAAAAGLAEAGASTVVNGRSQEAVGAAIAHIKQIHPGSSVTGVVADLTNADGMDALLEQVPELDILVNSIGIFEPVPFMEITDEEWVRYFNVNVLSGIRTTRAYIEGMRQRGWGRVVFVSSESALQIPPEMMHYGMTKTAQLAVSRGLAEYCAGTGVTVNSILPGPTASEGVMDFIAKLYPGDSRSPAELTDEFVREQRPTQLLRRAATPTEVASMIVYLCSRQASATTGAAVSVDGGTRRSIV